MASSSAVFGVPCGSFRLGSFVLRALMLLAVLTEASALPAQPAAGAPDVRGLTPLAVSGVNVGLGAGVAGLRAWQAGRAVRPALWRGAVGGGLMAGGLAMGGVRAEAARLLSVQAVALGASAARNAGDGIGMWDRVTMPLAPLLIERRRVGGATAAWRVRLSVSAAVGVVQQRIGPAPGALDWAATLRVGAPVFRTSGSDFDRGVACPPDTPCVRAGRQRLASITYLGGRSPAAQQATLAHESLHVAQWARDVVLFGEPVGAAALARGGGLGSHLARYVALDGVLPLLWLNEATARAGGRRYGTWYEREARSAAPGSADSFRWPTAR